MGIGHDQSSVESWLVQPIMELLSAEGGCAVRAVNRAYIKQLANCRQMKSNFTILVENYNDGTCTLIITFIRFIMHTIT